VAFSSYKRAVHPNIDDFAKELFRAFLGSEDGDQAVCHFEIRNYNLRKPLLIKMREYVQPRHRERFTSLVTGFLQACEAKPRTRNPFASSKQKVENIEDS
jgi:hypothetical protein